MSDHPTTPEGAPATAAERFCHLHVHSEYSSLDGACKIKDLVALAAERGHTHVGLSDHGTMSGLPGFYKAAKAAGVTPVLGAEIYLTPDRHRKEKGTQTWHLGLIARSTEGYENLCRITSRAYLEGWGGNSGIFARPRADWEVLGDHSQGIIALTGCMAAPVMSAIFQGDLTGARQHTERLIEIFGRDNVYGEIQNVGIVEQIPADSELAHKLGKFTLSQTEANRELATICESLGLPLVATGDVHYLRAEDAVPHDALLCVGTGQLQARTPAGEVELEPARAQSDGRFRRKFSLLPKKYYFRTEAEMREALPEWPQALANAQKLAERCEAQIPEGREMLPRFPVPDGFADEAAYLRHLCEEGMVWRYGPREGQTDEQRERLEFELGVIGRMGYAGYFLIVGDFFQFARDKGIATGPGRGSAAGSIVAYALGITQLCPLEYGLLFERFLNPDRVSMPDVDCDFSIVRRGEVIDYVRDKYNQLAGCETAVSQIITHGMIGAKAGLRDAGRVLDKPLSLVNKLAKMVPDKPVGMSLRDVYKNVPAFRSAFENDPDARELITLAGWLEGFVRNEGVHAAGVVIWDQPLESAMPIQRKGPNAPLTTSYEMKHVEAAGALKMDFLGLRNLDIIWRAIEIVKYTEGIRLDPYAIPLDDAATYQMLARGEAIGVFQFECVAGDTILNGDLRTTIAELHQRPPTAMLSVDLGEGRRRRNRVLRVVATGEKQLYRLTTAGGYTLRATADHRILTADGWKPLGELTSDDQVVVNVRDASRIGACLDCGVQVRSRGGRCRACANRRIGSGQRMSRNRNPEAWRRSLRRGPSSPWWGREPLPATLEFPDLDHPVRSVWEADFARALRAAGIAYAYEPRTFRFADGSGYTPDFHLPALGVWVEVKGKSGLCGRGKARVDRFRAEYPDERLRVISAHEIAEFELAHPDFADWNCPKLPPSFGFDQVVSVTKDAIEPTFDVVMEAPLNNYVANGIVVHNSGGMRSALQQVGPTEFEDLIALVALYRPGPMEFIPTYAARKQGREETTFLDPRLEPITGPSYGVAIYQEQLMTTAKELAGFTPGEADTLRKAIGKKDAALMASLKPKFVSGCVANGVAKGAAEQLWDDNERAAEYSFNRSHAACYGYLAYATAYLKCNHPAAYMAALISLNASTKDKVPFFITEARRMGLRVLPPDVNRSLRDFAVMEVEERAEGEPRFEILFGLSAIKGVGEGVIADLRAERERGGPFRSVFDLINRLPHLSKAVVELLVRAGSLDCTGAPRKAMLEAVAPAKEAQAKRAKEREKAYLRAVTDQVLASIVAGGQETPAATPAPSAEPSAGTLFDLALEQATPAPTPTKKAAPTKAKLTTEQKRGIEAVAKASHAAGGPVGEADARAAARKALASEALRKIRAALRKDADLVLDPEQLEEKAQAELAAGAAERAVAADEIAAQALAAIGVVAEAAEEAEGLEAALSEALEWPQLGTEDWPELERLNEERKVLGLYASGHPLDGSKRQWRRYISHTLGSLGGANIGQVVTVVGVVTSARELKKKTGESFGFEYTLDDLTGSRPVTFFNDALDDMAEGLLAPGGLCVIKAKVQEDAFQARKNEEAGDEDGADVDAKPVKLNGLSVHPWRPEQVSLDPIRPLEINLPPDRRTPKVVAQLKEVLGAHPGRSPVVLLLDGARHELRERVELNPTLMREVATLAGAAEPAAA